MGQPQNIRRREKQITNANKTKTKLICQRASVENLPHHIVYKPMTANA